MFPYIALILAELSNAAKKFAMKKCGKTTPGPFNSVCINMMRAGICTVISLITWLIAGTGADTGKGNAIIIIVGIGMVLDVFCYIISSSMLPLVFISSVNMIASMVLPLILAPYVFNGDKVSPIQWLGCALIFFSVFLFAKKETGEKKSAPLIVKILAVLGGSTGIFLAQMFKKYYTVHYLQNGVGSAEYFTFVTFLTMIVIFSVMFSCFIAAKKIGISRIKKTIPEEGRESAEKEIPKIELPYKKVWYLVLIAATALYAYQLLTVHATKLPSALYFPLTNSVSFIFSFLVDIIFFKDKVTPKKIVGLFVIITAIVLVGI